MSDAVHVVVFGSAADPRSRPRARDIDIAWRGSTPDARDQALVLARSWAVQHGCGHLPIDAHPAAGTGARDVRIPAPCGVRGAATPLTSGTTITWVDVDRLSSRVRTHGSRGAQVLAAHLPAQARLTVIAAPSHMPEPDWATYTDGLAALRNAVAATPDPAAVRGLLAVAYGQLIERLLLADPAPTPAGLATLQGGSPVRAGGAVVLLLRRDHPPRLSYGHRGGDGVETLLYPPPAQATSRGADR